MGTVLDTVTYTYGDSNWGDLLTGYDGKTITYDTIGNPLSDGTWTYTWEHGRELASMSNGSTTWSYEYNADGLRTKRTNGSTTYSYIYNGSSLSRMTVGSNTLYFAYDATGTPMSVTYNDTVYYYVTNIQGDITAILNTSGTAVVQYTYDAWGNILTTTGSMASTLGETNPLRYRGYVYDRETGFYYLQSRYYDPEIARFLNADAFASTGQGVLGNNMFAYCGCNPVMYSDWTGTARCADMTCLNDSGRFYIYDQESEPFNAMPFGEGTIGENGCGVIATYNAMITLGDARSFEEIYDYYTCNSIRMLCNGKMGTNPLSIVGFFVRKGYKVRVTDGWDGIDIYSSVADACIMMYAFKSTNGGVGAHYIEYSRSPLGYTGRNTAENGGQATFQYPSDYGCKGSRFFVVGIFIFK